MQTVFLNQQLCILVTCDRIYVVWKYRDGQVTEVRR